MMRNYRRSGVYLTVCGQICRGDSVTTDVGRKLDKSVSILLRETTYQLRFWILLY